MLSKRLIVTIALLFSICSQASAHYTFKKTGNTTAIVFVHGVMGDSTSTWTNTQTNKYWPKMLQEDPAFRDSDIYVYDYPSSLITSSYSIDELTDDMRLSFDTDDVFEHKNVVFLVHSMGGLITRAFLEKYRERVKNVRFIYFFATPTTGSSVSSLANLISNNSQFSDMTSMQSGSYVANIQSTWLAAPDLTSLPSFCAFETQPTKGLLIVPQQSATNLCNRRLDPINANHINIVKPSSVDDKPYKAFRSAYVSIFKDRSSSLPPLRLETQDVSQSVESIGNEPLIIDGNSILCESATMNLVLALHEKNSNPIIIKKISIKSEPITFHELNPSQKCKINRLKSRPHGITEVNTYIVTVTDEGLNAKLIKSASDVVQVSSENLLKVGARQSMITLKAGEEPTAFAIYLETKTKTAQRVWIHAEYDADGEQSIDSEKLIMWR